MLLYLYTVGRGGVVLKGSKTMDSIMLGIGIILLIVLTAAAILLIVRLPKQSRLLEYILESSLVLLSADAVVLGFLYDEALWQGVGALFLVLAVPALALHIRKDIRVR